jgi:hypothetical protein
MNCNPRSLWISSIATSVLTLVCLTGPIATATAQDHGTAATIIADQVRSQGFTCKSPSSAERIQAESAPNETVYLLKCEGITYRVLLIPDQASEVTRVE